MNKLKKDNFKNCSKCKKKLRRDEKNFRFKNKKKNLLSYRSVCRPCERRINSEYLKTPEGKRLKSIRDKRYSRYSPVH
jgi:hypothetical protein